MKIQFGYYLQYNNNKDQNPKKVINTKSGECKFVNLSYYANKPNERGRQTETEAETEKKNKLPKRTKRKKDRQQLKRFLPMRWCIDENHLNM